MRLADATREIVRRAGTDEKPIVRLAGCDTREEAEALRGDAAARSRAPTPPLEEGEFWAHELEGCAVIDGERAVGVVRAMRALPSSRCSRSPRDGAELLVPMVRDAIRSIDIEARRIDVDLGFLGDG